MKKINSKNILKALVIFLIVASWLVSAKMIFDKLSQAARVNSEVVSLYSLGLDVDLVEKAAAILQREGK